MPEAMRKTRILVVDDERVIADTLALILRQRGFEAITAYSGEQAVAAALEASPDVFISDINMGAINGIEAAITIAGHRPGCQILLFSGHPATSEMLIKARKDGHAFEALTKPVHPEKLLEWLAAKGFER